MFSTLAMENFPGRSLLVSRSYDPLAKGVTH